MSTILMSIKPEYIKKIFDGTKKYEYRKTKCKIKPTKIIVYTSSPIKKVVGEIIIEDILYDKKEIIWDKTKVSGGIEKKNYDKYFEKKDNAIAYKIKEYIKYDSPKELSEYNIKYAPQSYVYIK